jgi:gliding motility-associated-like protein
MKKIFFLITLAFFLYNNKAFSQPTVQDCMGAIPVCLNTYNEYNGYTGYGNYNDIPAASCPTTCMSAGELNSVWYTFTVQSTGWFDMRITPWVSSDDYDWALFDLTTDNCSSLSNTSLLPTLEVSCNWSVTGGITGCNNLGNNTGVDCWGSGATYTNNPRVWVTAGSTFYLNISNYSGYGAGHGYQLDMTNSTATIFDNVRPYMLAAPTPVACGATTITITMSENVLCSTVSAADFTIAGHTVTAVSGAVCTAGGTMENTFTLTINPALDPGVHTICINGSAGHISDACGNLTDPANPNNCRNFTVSGITTTVSGAPLSICAGQSSTLTAAGATSYSWSGGLGTGNPVTATPGVTTTYTVTGTTGGCTSSAAVTVTVTPGLTVTIGASANPICAGASTTLTAGGATSYVWSGGLGAGNPVTATPGGTTNYTVTGTTAGCTGSAMITVNVNSIPPVTLSASPNPICLGASCTLTAGGATGYAWSAGAGPGNPCNVTPGATTNYTVTGTTAGCTNSAMVTVTVSPSLSITIGASANPICAGSSTTLTAGGATSYVWSGGLPATNPVTATPAGTTTYTVTGTTGGCTGSAAITVNVNAIPNVTASAAPPSICQGASSSLSGGGATTYAWSGGLGVGSPVTATPALTTTYTVTGTAGGCTNSATVTVTVNPVTASAGADMVQGACASSTNTLNGSGTGIAVLTYAWTPVTGLSNPNIANPVANPAATTTYTLTVTNGAGCTASDAMVVTVNTLTANAGLDGNTGACASSTYSLNGSGVGIGPFTYAWTPITGLSNPAIANPIADPAVTTTYTLAVTDSYGCTASDAAIVNVAPLPTANAGADANIGGCATAANANLSGSGTGTGPLTYLWSPAAGLSNPNISNPVADPAATTIYTLTVSDTYGCSASDALIVTVAPIPTANAGSDAVEGACASAANVNLNGSGTGTAPISYTWSPVAGLSNPNIANPIANPVATTSYTLTVSDTYGCTATDNAVITVDPLPTASAGPDGNLGACGAGGFVLNGAGTGTGPLVYSWLPIAGLNNPNIANPTATPVITTTYTLTVTDAYGCSATDAAIVTVVTLPTANAGADGNIGTCATSTFNINGSGTGSLPITYSWLPVAGLSNPAIANPVAKPVSTTTYTLTVTDVFGCTATDAMVVNVNPLPTANAGADGAMGSCATSNYTLLGSGAGSAPLSYSWTPTTGLSNPNIATPVAQPAITTNYTLTVTDTYGCSVSDAATVTVNPLPTSNAGSDAIVGTCITSTTTFSGAGTGTAPLTFTWSPSTGLSNPAIFNPVCHPNATTTYTLTITDTYGCTATDALVVTVDPLPVSNAGIDASIGSCGSSSTILNGTGTGTAPLSYLWNPAIGLSNPAISNPTATPAATTTYTLTLTDTYGCTASDAMVVTIVPLPTANAGLDASIGSCPTSTTTLNGSGTGAAPLLYSWFPVLGLSNPNISNPIAQPASTTTYTLNIQDAYGCTASDAVVITVNPLPTSNAGSDANIGACPSSTTTLNGSGTGTAPLVYLWSPAAGLSNPGIANPVAKPAATTTYTLTITDMYGCTATDGVLITVNPVPTVNAGLDVTIGSCPVSIANLNGTAVGSVPFTYAWTPVTGLNNSNIANPQAHPSTTTNYTLTVTDIYGCSSSDALTVSVDPLPTAEAGNNATIGACPSSTTNLNGTGTGNGITFQWSPASGLSNANINNPVANPSNTTIYILTVTDTYGCAAIDNMTVTVVPLPIVSVTPANPGICTGGNVNLTASGALSYAWTPTTGLSSPNGASVNAFPNMTTTYTVTGSDVYGCTNTTSVTVTVTPIPVVTIIPAAPAICAGGSVLLTASGASTYNWSPSGGLSGTTGASNTANPGATITYTITGTASGCNGTNTVTVTVNPLPNVTFSAIADICSNAPAINLTNGNPAGGIYSGAGITGSSFNPSTAGAGAHTITYTYTDANNCTNSASQNINVITAPVVNVTPANPLICLGTSVTLNASGAIDYTWSPPTGLSGTTGPAVTASPLASTTYIVTGQANGCTNTASVTVDIYTNIAVQIIPNNVSICPGGYAVLTAVGGATYSWTPATGLSSTTAASVSASPTVTTTYTVIGIDAGGCFGTATATVNLYPNVLMDFVAHPNTGCPPLLVDFNFSPSPLIEDSSWLWNFGDASSGSSNTSIELTPSHTYNEPNIYIVSLTGTTTDGCSVSGYDTITVFDAPVADFIANPEVVTTENPTIDFIDQSLGAYFWNWNFGDPGSEEFNSSTDQNTQHYYTDSGYYTITLVVENLHGCTDTAVKYVTVHDAFAFFVPNAFSPNEDDVNDIFIPKGVGFKPETFEMWIFDRWGKVIFYSSDVNTGWDGTDQRTGKFQPQGVFTYIITLRDDSNLKRKFLGSITLLQ